jgi:hypothetical protein
MVVFFVVVFVVVVVVAEVMVGQAARKCDTGDQSDVSISELRAIS